jgi:TonB family protein
MIILTSLVAAATAVPVASTSSWIRDEDYPQQAIDRSADGIVEVELNVGQDGKPTNCTVIKPALEESLNSTSCQLLIDRARFLPLRESNQAAQLRTYHQLVSWKIPSPGPIAAISSGTVVKINIAPGGTLGQCVEQKLGNQKLDLGDFCETSKNPKMLEYLARDSLANLEAIYFRTIVTPREKNVLRVESVTASATRRLLMTLSFTVSKLGFVGNCKIDQIDEIFAGRDPCDGASKSSPDFLPDPTLAAPKPMGVVVDMYAEKRANSSTDKR